ncbi:hypothetical protein P4S72_26710 [Vibrio sp. PP-XX7]
MAVTCILSGAAFNTSAFAADFCSTDTVYPAHRNILCQLEKWVKGEQLPTTNYTLSSEKTAVNIPPEELLGDLAVRQNHTTFNVSQRYQNCEDVYTVFSNNTGLHADQVQCKSGDYGFNASSYSISGGYCSTTSLWFRNVHNQKSGFNTGRCRCFKRDARLGISRSFITDGDEDLSHGSFRIHSYRHGGITIFIKTRWLMPTGFPVKPPSNGITHLRLMLTEYLL